MTIEYLKEHGSNRMGVGEYIKAEHGFTFKPIAGLRIWKCDGRYYQVTDDTEVIMLNDSILDNYETENR